MIHTLKSPFAVVFSLCSLVRSLSSLPKPSSRGAGAGLTLCPSSSQLRFLFWLPGQASSPRFITPGSGPWDEELPGAASLFPLARDGDGAMRSSCMPGILMGKDREGNRSPFPRNSHLLVLPGLRRAQLFSPKGKRGTRTTKEEIWSHRELKKRGVSTEL